MLCRTYEGLNCSIARSLEVVGERWTLLILRDAFLGVRRFDDFQHSLGVTRTVLSTRLGLLVEEGVLDRVRYQTRPERYEYQPTAKGWELWPVLMHLLNWGDRHYPNSAGPARIIEHAGCGGQMDANLRCARCGEALTPGKVTSHTAPPAAPTN